MSAYTVMSLMYGLYLVLLGGVIGIILHLALSFALRIPKRRYWKDALLGACGMVGGFPLCAFVPWPENTVTYKIGETLVTSTMNRFQHPYYVAFVLALCFPLIRLGIQHRATRG